MFLNNKYEDGAKPTDVKTAKGMSLVFQVMLDVVVKDASGAPVAGAEVVLTDKDGVTHRMAGLLGLVTSYEKRKFHLGYRRAVLQAAMPGFTPGMALRGHEFHYSTILEQPDAPLAQVFDADGNPVVETGSVRGHVSGTFFHLITGEGGMA